MAEGKRGDWVVTIEAKVRKEVLVRGALKADASFDPYSCDVINERELETIDYKTIDIREN